LKVQISWSWTFWTAPVIGPLVSCTRFSPALLQARPSIAPTTKTVTVQKASNQVV
jgi:hypothetical protein